MKAVVDVVTITPKKAEEYLENLLDGQRHVRETWVKQLADEMRNGRFLLSCDALVLIKGRLANGQHRMWAVVESNTPQQFILMRTDDDDLYKVIDAGLKRSVGDALGMANGAQCAAVCNLVLAYELKYITPLGMTKKPTRVQVIEYLEAHKDEFQDAAQLTKRLVTAGQNICPQSVTGAFLVLARRAQGEKADAFLHHVYKGDMPEDGTFELREKFLRNRMSKAKYPAQYLLALMIKSFNSQCRGTKLGTIKMMDGESFPRITEVKG